MIRSALHAQFSASVTCQPKSVVLELLAMHSVHVKAVLQQEAAVMHLTKQWRHCCPVAPQCHHASTVILVGQVPVHGATPAWRYLCHAGQQHRDRFAPYLPTGKAVLSAQSALSLPCSLGRCQPCGISDCLYDTMQKESRRMIMAGMKRRHAGQCRPEYLHGCDICKHVLCIAEAELCLK